MLIHRDVSEYVQKARVFVSAHKDRSWKSCCLCGSQQRDSRNVSDHIIAEGPLRNFWRFARTLWHSSSQSGTVERALWRSVARWRRCGSKSRTMGLLCKEHLRAKISKGCPLQGGGVL